MKRTAAKLELLAVWCVVMFPLYSLCDETLHQVLGDEEDGCQA